MREENREEKESKTYQENVTLHGEFTTTAKSVATDNSDDGSADLVDTADVIEQTAFVRINKRQSRHISRKLKEKLMNKNEKMRGEKKEEKHI